jgi:hypothetical protein
LRILALAVVLVSLLACESALAATTPSTYRAQASAICKSTDTALAKIAAPKSASQVGKYFDAVLPVFEGQYDSLRKLRVPSSFATLVEQVLAAEKAQLAGLRGLSDQVKKGADPAKALASMDKKITAASNDEDAAWKKMNISACVG